jgi:hypothetical protein
MKIDAPENEKQDECGNEAVGDPVNAMQKSSTHFTAPVALALVNPPLK